MDDPTLLESARRCRVFLMEAHANEWLSVVALLEHVLDGILDGLNDQRH